MFWVSVIIKKQDDTCSTCVLFWNFTWHWRQKRCSWKMLKLKALSLQVCRKDLKARATDVSKRCSANNSHISHQQKTKNWRYPETTFVKDAKLKPAIHHDCQKRNTRSFLNHQLWNEIKPTMNAYATWMILYYSTLLPRGKEDLKPNISLMPQFWNYFTLHSFLMCQVYERRKPRSSHVIRLG